MLCGRQISTSAFGISSRSKASCVRVQRAGIQTVYASPISPSKSEGLSAVEPDRRQLLLGLISLGAASAAGPSPVQAETTFETFFGLASPPAIYGGSANSFEIPKYSFEYPAGWKSEKISKVEKGMQGIDGRVVNPRVKGQSAFVVTLGRAGEDNKSFQLRDLDSTFAGFAGADYELQDSLMNATEVTRGQHKDENSGIPFYDYDIESPDFRYLASIAVKDGRVFALFVRSPSRSFAASEPALRHVLQSFKLL